MGGCQIIRTGLFPHSSDRAVTVSCCLGHTCLRSSSRRCSSAAATLKIVGLAIGIIQMITNSPHAALRTGNAH